jgi:uncharacterized protein YjdB
MKKGFLFVLIFCMLFISSTSYATVKTLPNIRLNTSAVTLEVGELFSLKASVYPSGSPTWSSSNSKVASVNRVGCVSAHKEGKATITAKFGQKKATCIVTVTKAYIQLNHTELTLSKGTCIYLKAKSLSNSKSKIVWTATSSKILTVDCSTGKVLAVGKGTGYVYAFQNGHKARCKITVK